MICNPHQQIVRNKIKNNEMGRACSLGGGGERHVHNCGGET
jgi:hypothetical protein